MPYFEEGRPLSKYFEKHYRIVELEDFYCSKCKNWFGVDYEACEIKENTLGDAWYIFRCPYCGIKQAVYI